MVKSLKKGALFGLVAFTCMATGSAHADRVLTEHEAGKLTFSALIAPPSAFYHAPRKVAARAQHVSAWRLAAMTHRHAGASVRTVLYHGRVSAKHRRNMHHRRG